MMRKHAPVLEALARYDERHDTRVGVDGARCCFVRPLCPDVSVERRGERYAASCARPELEAEGASEDEALEALRRRVEAHYESEPDLWGPRC
jgi:hypothetical protein